MFHSLSHIVGFSLLIPLANSSRDCMVIVFTLCEIYYSTEKAGIIKELLNFFLTQHAKFVTKTKTNWLLLL